MTRLIPVSALALILTACGGGAGAPADDAPAAPIEVAGSGDIVGAAPAAGAVLPASEVIARADELDGQVIRVEGEIAEVCQMAGCWLTFHNEAGVPFREAHHIAGRAVAAAEAKGISLDALTLDDLRVIDSRIAGDTLNVLSVEASVASRTSAGGTAPERVADAVAAARAARRVRDAS